MKGEMDIGRRNAQQRAGVDGASASDPALGLALRLLRAESALDAERAGQARLIAEQHERAAEQHELAAAMERARAESEMAVERLQAEIGQLRVDLAQRERELERAESHLAAIVRSTRFRVGSVLAYVPSRVRQFLGSKRRTEPFIIAPIAETASEHAQPDRLEAEPAMAPCVLPPLAELPDIEGRVIHPEAVELFDLPAPPPLPACLSQLQVAAILDTFSLENLAPDCVLQPLHPERWLEQLRTNPPHLLLVESAWRGIDGEWTGLVERASPVLRSLVGSCRAAGIPTVFWNKEDPLHFEAFLQAARLFDQVFTTDSNSLPRYLRELGHGQVRLMPFAVQPRTHHPIQDGERLESAVFAGAWYGRLPDRCQDFSRVVDALAIAGPVAIHDRHQGTGAAHQQFPPKYQPLLRGGVPYRETPALYRAHRIGINLNTIKQSATMFARRALELMGCGTSVYGNFSRGLCRMFGDLTVSSDDSERLLREAWEELRNPGAVRFRQRRLRALRKVLSQHTWGHRLHAITEAALGVGLVRHEGKLWVLARAGDGEQLQRIVTAFGRQREVDATLLLDLAPGLSLPEGACRLSPDHGPSGEDWLAFFHPDDHYGPHYLEDLSLARKFCLGAAVGKGAWFALSGDVPSLQNAECEYRRVPSLQLRRSLVRRSRCPADLASLMDTLTEASVSGEDLVSIDALSYLEGGAGRGLPEYDGPCFDEGIHLHDMHAFLATLKPAPDPCAENEDAISGAQLAALFNQGIVPPGTSASVREGRLEICSLLPADREDAMFSATLARDLVERDGVVRACLHAPPSSQLDLYLDALDEQGQPLARLNLPRGLQARMPIPPGTAGYRIAVAVRGGFVRQVDGLWLGKSPAIPVLLPGAGRILIVCNGYPETGNLYRNAFVHRRVLGYKRRGIGVDVLWVSPHAAPRSFEHEGVAVQVCDPAILRETVKRSRHEAIAVHFLDESIWEGLEEVASRKRTLVWVHGAEIQPWTRRAFNYCTESEREAAAASSDERMAFWRRLLTNVPAGLHLIFVSRTLAEMAWEDLGLRLPEHRFCVIHNPIDVEHFEYLQKPAEQRTKILSIRPYASRTYANDLSVQAILELSRRPGFSSLQFRLIGDGPLFEETVAPLAALPNVAIERRFLSHKEVSELHREYGMFLCPTRMDSQGGSRDEAMASGLVPVTNAVAAVPEFVDERCGILASPEDALAMALPMGSGIERIAHDPTLFLAMSRAASERVRSINEGQRLIEAELQVFFDSNGK